MPLNYVDKKGRHVEVDIVGEIKSIILSTTTSNKKDLAPAGWLLCDGSEYSLEGDGSKYRRLATHLGVDESATSFNVPDLRGKVLQMGVLTDVNNKTTKHILKDGQTIQSTVPVVKGTITVVPTPTEKNATLTSPKGALNYDNDSNTLRVSSTTTTGGTSYGDLEINYNDSNQIYKNNNGNSISESDLITNTINGTYTTGTAQPAAFSVSYVIRY